MGDESGRKTTYRLSEIGLLTAGLMHEIKNPLGFVHSNLATLAKYADRCGEMFEAYSALEQAASQVPEMREALGKVRASLKKTRFEIVLEDLRPVIDHSVFGTTHMKEIIAAVESVARGHAAIPAKANIEDCVEQALFLASHELKERVEIKRELDDLDDIECKAGALIQVFLNLVVNAAHAIDGQGRVTVRTRQDDTWVVVEVEDDGCGIPEHEVEKIFSPFYSTKESGKGTGLGLSLSVEIVRDHGGKVEVDSVPGKGSTFRVFLPRHPGALPLAGGGEECRP